jgi:histidine triad (HIT) family protein
LALRHPQPLYPLHVLILVKGPFRSLLEIPERPPDLLGEILAAVKHLVSTGGLERSGYRLILNGGEYQDVEVLHIHLVAGERLGIQNVTAGVQDPRELSP